MVIEYFLAVYVEGNSSLFADHVLKRLTRTRRSLRNEQFVYNLKGICGGTHGLDSVDDAYLEHRDVRFGSVHKGGEYASKGSRHGNAR